MGIFTDGGGGWSPGEAKRCDHCTSSPAVVFCGSHNAFMCMPCDAACHHGRILRHERAWICDVCEQNPAAVTCKADAAALCFACDRDIHAANPLARRHQRVPALPFSDSAESLLLRATTTHLICSGGGGSICAPHGGYMGNNNAPLNEKVADTKSLTTSSLDHLLFSDDIDDDHLLGFDRTPSTYDQDSIVPMQTSSLSSLISIQTNTSHDNHLLENHCFDIFDDLLKPSFYCNSFNTPPFSMSSSSLDIGIVPEGSSMISSSDVSNNPLSLPKPSSKAEVMSSHGHATAKDVREAKVRRYREKRKNRKFEKTVRYASRKAYAESRPRIKGRFAKKPADDQSDIDFDYDADFGAIAANFIVPSF